MFCSCSKKQIYFAINISFETKRVVDIFEFIFGGVKINFKHVTLIFWFSFQFFFVNIFGCSLVELILFLEFIFIL
jgi:hypothetical protein